VFIANTLKCLRYNAPVQLGDGSWERIGRLVRARYSGTVMSVDPSGELVRRRVTGWHASPLAGRRVFRLTYASAKQAGASRVSVQLTGDHPVLTERGYVPVEDLVPSDRVATGQGMSTLAYDLVCGTVLGDGSLGASPSSLTFSHSHKQEEYARFKSFLLAEFGATVESRVIAAAAGEGHTYQVVQVRTRASRSLRLLRDSFYQPRKIVPPWIASQLNPRMLAFWFMDDGHTRIRGAGRRPSAEIATVGFRHSDLTTLARGLLRLGLPTKILRGRMYFDVVATQRLCELIAPYIPPAMRYKLSPDVRNEIPFDPDVFVPGPVKVLYDTVETEDITDQKRGDTTFFCLDVDDTHNFVTAGGVVHNCRPPGNRDPQPVEIDNCHEYLLRQVELIEPSVICSLGNFSTKLLRGDPTGITRLHGQPEVIELGSRAVRLYPIFHPAAALYTPRMLETLREDFARLPELLSLGPPEQPLPAEAPPELDPEPPPQEAAPTNVETSAEAAEVDQLGLF
jgi:hypothetical protein